MELKLELKNMVIDEKNDLINNYKNGNLYEYLMDRLIEIKKNNDGDINFLIFTMGGPHIELDMGVERAGIVCGYWDGQKAFSSIPIEIWYEIENEIVNSLSFD